MLLHAAVAPAAAKSAAACCKASSNAFPSLPPGAMSRPAKTSPLKHSTLPWLSTKGLVLRLLPRSCSSDAARCSSTCAVLLCWLPCAVLLSLVSEVAAVVVLAPAPSGHGTDTDTCGANPELCCRITGLHACTRMHQLVLLKTALAANMFKEDFKASRSPVGPCPQLLTPQWAPPLLLSLLTYLQSSQVVWAPAA